MVLDRTKPKPRTRYRQTSEEEGTSATIATTRKWRNVRRESSVKNKTGYRARLTKVQYLQQDSEESHDNDESDTDDNSYSAYDDSSDSNNT
jgi:hypothetical protein